MKIHTPTKRTQKVGFWMWVLHSAQAFQIITIMSLYVPIVMFSLLLAVAVWFQIGILGLFSTVMLALSLARGWKMRYIHKFPMQTNIMQAVYGKNEEVLEYARK